MVIVENAILEYSTMNNNVLELNNSCIYINKSSNDIIINGKEVIFGKDLKFLGSSKFIISNTRFLRESFLLWHLEYYKTNKILDLVNNILKRFNLRTTKRGIDEMVYLLKLRLEGYEIMETEALQKLIYKNHHLNKFPDIKFGNELKEVDLSNNNLVVVPDWVKNTHIIKLNLSKNRISYFIVRIGELESLEQLDLSYNLMKIRDVNFDRLTELRIFNAPIIK